MTTSSKPKSWRDVIKVHPAAEIFPDPTPAELKALGEDIERNGLITKVAIFDNGDGPKLVDGRCRLDAMELIGLPVLNEQGDGIDDDISWTWQGPDDDSGDDAYTFALSANLHRRHLTAEDKRDVIAKWLKANPEKSNRQIAEAVKVDHKTVASVRAEKHATGEIPQLTKTVGKDGKARKTPERTSDVSNSDTRKDSEGRQQSAHESPKAAPRALDPVDQPSPATLISSERDVIIAEYTMCLTGMIDEAAHRLDPSECVTLLERLLSIINGLLVGAKHAAESTGEETPETVSPAPTKPKPPQPDDLDIPEYLKRQPS